MNKELKLSSDVVIKYWALQSAIIDFKKNVAVVSFCGYVNEEAFVGGKDKVLERSLEINILELSEKGGLIVFIEAAIMEALEKESQA